MKKLLIGLCVLGCLSAPRTFAGESGLHVIDTIPVGGTGGWDYLNFDSVTRTLFVTHGASIAAITVDSRKVTPHLADASGAHIALPLGDGKTLLLTQGKTNKVSFIDAGTGGDLGDLDTGAKPDGAIIDPLTRQVFVLDNGGGQIDVIDITSRKRTGAIKVDGAPEGGAADGRGLLFTHLEDKNAIVVIDTRTRTVKTTYEIKDCDGPTGLAFVPEQRLLLSACGNGIARITNADTGAEVATMAIGQHADGALYDPARKLGYVPSGDGKLTVISFNGAPRVTDVVITKSGARTAAFDPESGHIYLSTADYGPPAKPGDRPSIVPDTFAVLVVGQ